MAWFEVLGPYSGLPVRVREQDVGRAVKDEEGRVFYLMKKGVGSGYYGSTTRFGGEQEEAKYEAMLAKGEHARRVAEERHAEAVGPKAAGRCGCKSGCESGCKACKVVVVLVLLAGVAAAAVYVTGPWWLKLWG